MSPLFCLTKVFMVDATNEILTAQAVLDWRNVLSLEDDGGAKWEYDAPRTYFITNHGEFFALGTLEAHFAAMQQWEDFEASTPALLFSRN